MIEFENNLKITFTGQDVETLRTVCELTRFIPSIVDLDKKSDSFDIVWIQSKLNDPIMRNRVYELINDVINLTVLGYKTHVDTEG